MYHVSSPGCDREICLVISTYWTCIIFRIDLASFSQLRPSFCHLFLQNINGMFELTREEAEIAHKIW